MRRAIFLYIFLVFSFMAYAQNSIIPKPVNYQSKSGEFIIDQALVFNTPRNIDLVNSSVADFQEFLKEQNIHFAPNGTKMAGKMINVEVKEFNKELGKEGYVLAVGENSIDIKANQAAGVWNAFQSLKQLIPLGNQDEPRSIVACTITDYPRFGWRGLMLDVSRHFFDVDEVKAYIDKMAEYKFNVFHWHLTDDEGWRIEIKSLPKLTEVGAWRVEGYGRFGEDR